MKTLFEHPIIFHTLLSLAHGADLFILFYFPPI